MGYTAGLSFCRLIFCEILNKKLKANLMFTTLEMEKSKLVGPENGKERASLFQASKYCYLLHISLSQEKFIDY